MQTVFKLDLPAPARACGEKTFTTRKAHKKSRGGCLACKKRRIKCDEARPHCARCLRIGADCSYKQQRVNATSTPDTPLEDTTSPVEDDRRVVYAGNVQADPATQQSPSADMYSMSVDLLNTELDVMLDHAGYALDVSAVDGNVRLLQHFHGTTNLTLGGPRHRQAFQASIKQKASNLPYLMHMTLAVSCAHLKRLILAAGNLDMYRRYAVAEATHWQSGLQLYRQALAASTADFDGIIAATFLSIIFTFALDDHIPQDSYAADDSEKLTHAMNPLAATGGFGAVRAFLGEGIMDTIWRYVFIDSDDNKGTFSTDGSGIEGLPAAFVNLCDLNESSTTENSPYYTIVHLLAPLLRLESHPRNFTKLIAFSGRTWRHTRHLLLQRDPRALLLISYWFALLHQVDQWWITTRATTECMAISFYLCQLGDPKITALLPFPASLGKADIGYIW